MSIGGPEDLEGLIEVGRVVRACLDAMRLEARPGVTTAHLNRVGAAVLEKRGARSAPMLVYDFPAENCISVNDEIVHGIPSRRKLRAGDLLKLDVTAEKNGYMADAAITVPVGGVTAPQRELMACAERAFQAAMAVLRPGRRANEIGRVIEDEVHRAGFVVVRELSGHGIGRTIHEPPTIPNYDDPAATDVLTRGMVITVEPLIAMGNGRSFEASDGWTIRTQDGSDAAHYEQTLVVMDDGPLLLTAA